MVSIAVLASVAGVAVIAVAAMYAVTTAWSKTFRVFLSQMGSMERRLAEIENWTRPKPMKVDSGGQTGVRSNPAEPLDVKPSGGPQPGNESA
jgi:hypothetical protein